AQKEAKPHLPEPDRVTIVRRDEPGKTPEAPKIPDPEKKPEAGAAFVGTWTASSTQLEQLNIDITVEFRADGKLSFQVRGQVQSPRGEGGGGGGGGGGKLRVDGGGAMGNHPAEVKWNGPNEFPATADDNMPIVFHRKGKPRP